jgi:AhpC/TSA family protein
MWPFVALLLTSFAAFAEEVHPILALGSPAPDFSLPGVDGKTHKLSDYSSSNILVIVFTCNHCPTAQLYETHLYDGDNQSVARAYGPQATPHLFIFDRDRKLRYQGRIDTASVNRWSKRRTRATLLMR